MKKILILGASGMAGHVIYSHLIDTNKYKILGTTNSNDFDFKCVKVNVFSNDELNEVLDTFRPDFVINCIGMLITGSKDFPDKTIYLNSYFPYLLLKLSKVKGFKLIHISTDCVFSGKTGKYTETSFKDATDLYGLSKSLGEINDDKNLTIRTSIIGPEIKSIGEGLFHWFMNQEKYVYGYKSNIWSGVTTLELSKFIDFAIDSETTGLFHLTNNIPISKFDLLHALNEIYKKGLYISDEKDYKCDKSFVNTNLKVAYKVNSYSVMLENQLDFMINKASFYPHYFLQ
jgi:dTDP-4-dehydrorhamnose reductase